MASSTESSDSALEVTLDAHVLLMNQALGYLKSMCLKGAVQLGIPDAILRHGNPATISDLCSILSIRPTKSLLLLTLMRLLSSEGLFTSQLTLSSEEEVFDLNPVSRLLLTTTASPCSFSPPLILWFLDHLVVDTGLRLSEWFLRPDVVTEIFTMVSGTTVWELAGMKHEANDLFNRAMACDTSFVMYVLTQTGGGPFHGIGTLVDVVGGTGTMAAALANAFPGLRCTVLDLPHAVETSEKPDGIQFVGGDMFLQVPRADAALLKVWSYRKMF